MNRTRPSYLKIVRNNDQVASNTDEYCEPAQLTFQIEHDENLIAFIGEKGLSGILLTDVLQKLKPNYLLDLRKSPRFDLSGYSRKKAFSDFDRLKAKYICLSIDETVGEISERVQSLISKLDNEQNKLTGPILILVESADAIDQVYQAMPEPNTGTGKWSITIDEKLRAEA